MAIDSLERPAATLESEILEWSEAVYEEAERDQLESRELRITGKLIDYISNQQWNAKSRYGRSRPVVNRLFRQFIEMSGLLTDIEPDFQVKFAREDEDEYLELQKFLNEEIGIWSRVTDFEAELTQTVMWSLIHTGWSKQQWNPTMNGGLGDVEYIPLSPLNVMTIGAGNKIQDEEVVIGRWPVTVESLHRTYGDVAEGVIPDLESGEPTGEMMRPGKMSESSWVRLPPALKKMLGKRPLNAKKSRYPRVMLKQFWFRDPSINESSTTMLVGKKGYNWSYFVEPGMPIYPRGRFIITAGGKILQDNCNPYWSGLYPFAKLRLIRVPWSSSGASIMEPLAAMSDITNRINGGIMDMIRAAIEPRMVAPKAAFAQSIWDSLDPGAPGSKMAYNNNSPRAPEFPKPPELPAYVLAMKQDVEREQDMTSGAAAINQSLQKKQVPGGDSLEMIMNSRSIPIRFMGRNLHSYLVDVGTQVTALKMQFESSKARVRRFGKRGLTDADFQPYYGQWLEKGMEPEEFVRQATFSIRKGSLLSIEKQDEMRVAFALRKLGDLSRKGLYRKLGVPDPDVERIEQELLVEAQQKIAAAAAARMLQHKGKK